MPFVKGQSGNPRGRPPKGKALTDVLIKALETPRRDGSLPRDLIAERLIALALAGNVDAIKYLYDRVDGRPRQPSDVDVSGDLPILVVRGPGGGSGDCGDETSV